MFIIYKIAKPNLKMYNTIRVRNWKYKSQFTISGIHNTLNLSKLITFQWRRKVPTSGVAHRHVIYVPSIKNQYKRVVFGYMVIY